MVHQENVLIERAQNFVRRGIQAEKALAGGTSRNFAWTGYAKEQPLGYQSCQDRVIIPASDSSKSSVAARPDYPANYNLINPAQVSADNGLTFVTKG